MDIDTSVPETSPAIPATPADAAKMKSEKSQNYLLWLVAIGFFMETLDSTIVNTALPSMAKTLNRSPLEMYLVVISYALTIAVLIPASGWVADRFGIRRTFFSAIAIFSIGSLACAFSQTLPQLVMARVLQGIGGSMLLPVGRLAVIKTFPKDKYLDAISFVAIPALIGPLIGPTLGGFLVELSSWHWIFLINIPIGILGGIVTLMHMPELKGSAIARFDFVGYIQLAVSMVTISLALDGISELNFPIATVAILFLFGCAGTISYCLHAVRYAAPLFPLSLFKTRTYTIGLLGNMFARVGSGSMPFLIPLLLQVSLGYSPLHAGLMMIPVAAAGIAVKKFVTPTLRRFGYRNFLLTNTFFVGLAIASFSLISPEQPLWIRIIQMTLFGAVNSMQFTAMNSLTLQNLEGSAASSGNSLFSMVQMLAMSFGVSAAGALLSSFNERFAASSSLSSARAAFDATFICVGVITCSSALIFWHLSPDMISRRNPKPHIDTSAQ